MKSVVVKYDLGNAEKIIQSVGRFLLVYVRLSVMEGGGWRNKQHHLLSTKRIRPKLKVLYAVHAYIFRNSFRIHLLFLFFIHIKISVFIILPSRKDLCHFRKLTSLVFKNIRVSVIIELYKYIVYYCSECN